MKKSIFLFFAAILCAIGMNAAQVTPTGKYFYFKTNSEWKADGARFAVCFQWKEGGGQEDNWQSCVAVPGATDIYYVKAPAKYWDMFFCRMNGSTSTNNWSNKWDQSNKLQYNGTNNYFVKKAGWNGDVTYNSNYAPPMSSVTLSDNGTTINSGSGTEADPYIIEIGTTIKVKAEGTKAVEDPDATINYDFKQGSTSKQNGTGTTWTLDASTASTVYTINLDGYTKVNTASSTKKAAKALYFKTVADATLPTYQVTATANNNTMGTVIGTGEYSEGITVTLTATPADGYKFVNWTVGGAEVSTANPYTFTAEEDVIVVANFEELPKTTVYFVNTHGWTNVKAYAYSPENHTWPGVDATKEAEKIGDFDVYSYTATEGKYANVIFNGNGGQTADLTWSEGVDKYYIHGYNGNTGWYTKAEAEAILVVPVEYEYVYFINTNNWAAVNIYTWTPEVATWPGVAMTKETEQIAGFDVYSYKVVKGTSFGGMKFNEGQDKAQTGDLTWQAGKYYAPLKNEWYDTKEAAAEALAVPVEYDYVYLINTNDWAQAYIYTWESEVHSWPGAAMTKEAEQIAGKEVYSYKVVKGTTFGGLNFNCGGDECKTGNLTWQAGKYYAPSKNTWYDTKEAAAEALAAPVEYDYVYLINTNDWAQAYIYTWESEVHSWPGAAMTKEAEQIAGKDVYSYKVVKGTTFGGLNFNCGGDECKTGDLTWQAGKYYAPSKDTWYADAAAAEAGLTATPAPAKCYLMGIGGDWTTGIEMEEDGDQFKLLCQPIAEGEQFKFKYGDTWTTEVENYDANGVDWVESYPGSGQYNITLPAGNYDFYYKKNDNKVWIGVCTPATPTLVTPTVVANSYFSVADGKFVQFSTGNLQYEVGTNTWSFAANQYDYIGEANINVGNPAFTGTIDMFGWSTNDADNNYGVNPNNVNELYDGTFQDWSALVDEADWYTLSADEWKYLLNTRANAKNLKQIAKVDNVVGIMLFPDAWTMPADVNVAAAYDDYFKVNIYNYTLEQWTKLEEAGAVFLPAAGRRTGGYGNMINYDQQVETNPENLNGGHYKHQDNTNIYCYYWTSTINESTKDVSYLHNIQALGGDKYTIGTGAVWGEKGRYGQSVRLVKKVTPNYSRDVRQGDYGTICLPNGGLLLGASAFSVAKMEGTTILLDEVGTTMVGGTPYVVFPNTGATNLYVFYTDNANAPAGNVNGLYGSYTREELAPNAGNYIMLPGNKYAEVTGDRVFVAANRAYFKVSEISTTALAPAPGVRRIAIGQAPQVATGMENVDASAQPVKMIINGQLFILRGEKMYDAQGKLVK